MSEYPAETFVQAVSNAPLANTPSPSDAFPIIQGALLKQLPANAIPLLTVAPTVVINQTTYNATISNKVIFVDRSPAATTTINLPSNPGLGRTMIVKDIAGNCSGGDPINIGNATVDGNAAYSLSSNYAGVMLISTGVGNNWAVIP